MFFRVLEFVIIALGILFIFRQMIIPGIMGRPLFPYFRKEEQLKREVAEALQEHDETELEILVRKVKSATSKLRGKK
jgi:hypothetical protein